MTGAADTDGHRDGDAWLVTSGGQWFIFGQVDGAVFVLDGPWDDEAAAQRDLDRHRRWQAARP